MEIRDSALIMAWLAILLLAFGFAACVRALRAHDAILTEYTPPRRVRPGDVLRIPRDVVAEPARRHLLLFTSSDCSSCRRAVERLRAEAAGDPAWQLLVLWKGSGDHRSEPSEFEYQEPLFRELHIGLLPFAALVVHGRVLVSGGVGSAEELSDLLALVTHEVREDIRSGEPA